ncbi:hypothetical protein B566_EDAN006261 [Ephemera danica]|nr:hypothetical protein B566_EDAN006261 [Ephemera danica]
MNKTQNDEIGRVRSNLFQINGIKKEPLVLPDAQGPATTLSEKVYVPVKEHPDRSIIKLIREKSIHRCTQDGLQLFYYVGSHAILGSDWR